MAAETAGKPSARHFYEEALSAAERQEVPVALTIDGVDEEIAMLRLRLRTALEKRPADLPLMLRGLDVLRRLVASRYGLSKADEMGMNPFIEETLLRMRERGGDTSDA